MNSIRITMAVAVIGLAAEASAATRVYDVDPAYRQEVVEILREMLDTPQTDRELSGTVQLLPSGQILVDTLSNERQVEVALVLEAIASAESGPTPTVTLHYWMLQAAIGADDSVPIPSALEGVIDELETVYGELGILHLDAAIVSGRAGREAFYGTEIVEIVQTAYVNGNELNASIFVGSDVQELMVDVSLTAGEFLVLNSGSSGADVLALIVNWRGTER